MDQRDRAGNSCPGLEARSGNQQRHSHQFVIQSSAVKEYIVLTEALAMIRSQDYYGSPPEVSIVERVEDVPDALVDGLDLQRIELPQNLELLGSKVGSVVAESTWRRIVAKLGVELDGTRETRESGL